MLLEALLLISEELNVWNRKLMLMLRMYILIGINSYLFSRRITSYLINNTILFNL